MTGSQPPVSVVIPTRDRPALLRRAVDSVVAQEYAGDIEVLIVFDQQPDTFVAPQLPAGRRLVRLQNDRTPGLSGARNSGILAATGDLIAHCDDDDEWLAGKLRRQVERLAATNAPVVAGALEVKYGGKTHVRSSATSQIDRGAFLTSRRMEVHSSALIAPRETYDEIGLLDEALPMSYAEDYDWLLRATTLGPLEFVREPVVMINWDRPSWFADRWAGMAEAYHRLLDKHPELLIEPRSSARIYGQIAIATAASGSRRDALRWTRKTLRARPFEARGYVAALMSAGLLRPDTLLHMAHRMGKGV